MVFTPEDDVCPTQMFGCKHESPAACDGTEQLLYLLYKLGLTKPGLYTWPFQVMFARPMRKK